MKKTIAKTQDFVHRNRNAIIVGAITTSVIVLQHQGIKSLNEFLKDKDLFDEYYFVDEED